MDSEILDQLTNLGRDVAKREVAKRKLTLK